MNIEALSTKVPDFHFDWYARFIPGCVGVIFYFYLTEKPFSVSPSNLVLYAFFAYLAGHIVQPIVGFVVKTIEKYIKSDPESKYAKAKANPEYALLVSKVSKAHAEANSMLSCGFLLILLAFYFENSSKLAIALIVYFLSMTVERAFARKRKINDILTADA
ncbi:hypothetical protein N2488_11660 [SAR92 clade bacterium H231]|nr:hypothetical protein [SAR92 clade bacterium H231]